MLITDEELLFFAIKTIRQAGKILKSYKNNFKIKKVKDPLSLDIVTNADYSSETYIINRIKEKFPKHNIYSEESKSLENKSEYEWIIDPLDGTKEYIRNLPYYYVLLALELKKNLIMGVGYQPEINRFFACTKDQAILNGKKIYVSKQNELKSSFINVRLPTNKWTKKESSKYFECLKSFTYQVYRLRSTAWDAEGLFHVALGAVEGYILPPCSHKAGPKWYDVASGLAMVKAAGGTVTNFKGENIVNKDLSNGIIATNGYIHQNLLDFFNLYYKT